MYSNWKVDGTGKIQFFFLTLYLATFRYWQAIWLSRWQLKYFLNFCPENWGRWTPPFWRSNIFQTGLKLNSTTNQLVINQSSWDDPSTRRTWLLGEVPLRPPLTGRMGPGAEKTRWRFWRVPSWKWGVFYWNFRRFPVFFFETIMFQLSCWSVGVIFQGVFHSQEVGRDGSNLPPSMSPTFGRLVGSLDFSCDFTGYLRFLGIHGRTTKRNNGKLTMNEDSHLISIIRN